MDSMTGASDNGPAGATGIGGTTLPAATVEPTPSPLDALGALDLEGGIDDVPPRPRRRRSRLTTALAAGVLVVGGCVAGIAMQRAWGKTTTTTAALPPGVPAGRAPAPGTGANGTGAADATGGCDGRYSAALVAGAAPAQAAAPAAARVAAPASGAGSAAPPPPARS